MKPSIKIEIKQQSFYPEIDEYIKFLREETHGVFNFYLLDLPLSQKRDFENCGFDFIHPDYDKFAILKSLIQHEYVINKNGLYILVRFYDDSEKPSQNPT